MKETIDAQRQVLGGILLDESVLSAVLSTGLTAKDFSLNFGILFDYILEMKDELNIPVMCYGIRTDFKGNLFEGSSELLAIADNLNELKTICSECDKKATMVVRLNSNGEIILEGEKILIGGNEVYKTLCRKHFRKLTKLI